MSAIAISNVNELVRPERLADNLTKPIYWCGQQWAHLYDLGEGGIPYKILQVALRIIPTALLSVATVFSAWISMGPTYWVAKLVCELSNNAYNAAWGISNDPDAVEVDIAMDASLQDRCRALGLDNPNGPVNLDLPARIANDLALGRLGSVHVGSHEWTFQHGTRAPATIITASTFIYSRSYEMFLAGHRNPNTSYEAERYPFRNHEAVKEVANAILGISDGSDAARERVQTALHRANVATLAISQDLQHMKLRINASTW